MKNFITAIILSMSIAVPAKAEDVIKDYLFFLVEQNNDGVPRMIPGFFPLKVSDCPKAKERASSITKRAAKSYKATDYVVGCFTGTESELVEMLSSYKFKTSSF